MRKKCLPLILTAAAVFFLCATDARAKNYYEKVIQTKNSSILLHMPSGLKPGVHYPMALVLEPDGNLEKTYPVWTAIAKERHWIIAFLMNPVKDIPMAQAVRSLSGDIRALYSTYPVDPYYVYVSGMSAGGMVSHELIRRYPQLVRGGIFNSAMIHDAYRDVEAYPDNGVAALLVSPTDQNYTRVRKDEIFLQSLNWQTRVFEFGGGHQLAPIGIYRLACSWLEDISGYREAV